MFIELQNVHGAGSYLLNVNHIVRVERVFGSHVRTCIKMQDGRVIESGADYDTVKQRIEAATKPLNEAG